jgi:hypothetical protein
MRAEGRIRKELEGTGGVFIEALSWHLAGRIEKKKEPQKLELR